MTYEEALYAIGGPRRNIDVSTIRPGKKNENRWLELARKAIEAEEWLRTDRKVMRTRLDLLEAVVKRIHDAAFVGDDPDSALDALAAIRGFCGRAR